MDIFASVWLGFQTILFNPVNLFYCFMGVLIGTLVGVLPGIGPLGATAILLPVTFHVPPLSAIVMLAGIYYGAQYGGSTTSILVNIPGEVASIMTCLDGHQMALQGRAGPALGIAAFGSFIAGTYGVILLMVVARPLTSLALKFGPPEYFSLMVLGIIMLIFLAQKSLIKGLIMAVLGIVLSFVGMDIVSGQMRFTMNIDELLEGLGVVPMVIGLFGITEVLENLEVTIKRSLFKTHVKGLLPSIKDWAQAKWAIVRGTILGSFLGILPGSGAVLASFVSYSVEKRVSRHPEKFGTGAIEGVAAPESANNAAAQTNFIPLLTLGIPTNMITAMLFAGLLIHGITPGPLMLKEHPDVFWGVIASMYIGNAMLLVLNLPLIWVWVKVTRIPFRFLFPMITLFCVIGVYSINNSVFDLWVMIIFGLAGYILKKADYEPAPLTLAFVLGPMLEQNFRQSLFISNGSFIIFLSRPIALVCLALAVSLVTMSFTKYWKERGMLGSSEE
jgi:putative tricarboxylic transport membrane protein